MSCLISIHSLVVLIRRICLKIKAKFIPFGDHFINSRYLSLDKVLILREEVCSWWTLTTGRFTIKTMIDKKPKSSDWVRIFSPVTVKRSRLLRRPGGYSLKFLVGVCRPHLQVQTKFQTQKCYFPHPFSDLASKIHTRFQTSPGDR